MSHFLDETGNIPDSMPVEARRMASFLALIVYTTTLKNAHNKNALRCFIENCKGSVSSEFSDDKKEILWKCSDCENAGRISFWQNTKWDNKSSI